VTEESGLGAAMHAALPPDLAAAPEIGFIHRKLPFAEAYFVANTSNHPVKTQAAFRVTGLDAEWWDAMTGKTSPAGGNRLELDLAPYESRVVVFAKERLPEPPKPTGPAPAPVDISSGWKVTFTGAQPAEMSTLRSWTEEPDRKFYSGLATYEKTATVPDLHGHQLWLNFGEGTPVTAQERRAGSGMRAMFEGPVREAAVVYVNGKRAGAVWSAPYEVNVTGLVKPGENSIRVVVANTALNEMAKGPLPDYKALNAKYGERFQAQDMQSVQPIASGLLGPIRLVAR